ncbi:serine/threonine dehydratase [Alteromonas lipolytica]|uniref:Serine/threonine dehydratase n=1 Tax=Alteromonas lipolytica TaxID=1856405 RepID=A0A1E8FKE6_9ALTE|nr:serine/threonine dehydratase [Alteromonas lipolytica]OFI36226.1 serine/threonine dehydratase [Alteromonas lipolytica]GGF78956.1 serine/threonine dehydratase [Alteromonas lipolytica]
MESTAQQVSFNDVHQASLRLIGKVARTPLFESSRLNQWLGQRVLFKAECLQTTGAFKIRGATNFIASLQEQGLVPQHIVANSSGNHAQAVAYAASQAGIPVTIFSTENISEVKAAATQDYGAELRLYPTRPEADAAVEHAAQQEGVVWIPPFNHPLIVAGQGTAALEAIQDADQIDAIFAPCGGGGLLSGTLLATRQLAPHAKVIGAEPLLANDAARSLQSGVIESLDGPVNTLADGAATPAVGDVTFPLLQQLDDFYEVNEQQIAYWTQWLQHLLKLHVEPTSAMSMAAVAAWAANSPKGQTAMVILSGGNISKANMSRVWDTDYLLQPPIID